MLLGMTLQARRGGAQAGAEQWQAAAAELARQIALVTGPGTISLSVRSLSSIPQEETPRIQGLLEKDLADAGVKVRTGSETNDSVRVTLSQSARQGVWVGEVQQGPDVRVAMVTVALPARATRAPEPEMVLNRRLLLARAEPVLDVAEVAGAGGGTTLIVLGPEEVTFYSSGPSSTGTGQRDLSKTASFTLQHERPFPRDVRGRLEVNGQGWKAYLPGVVCVGSVSAETETARGASCSESDDPWPVGGRSALFHAGRNFFTGVTIPALAGDAAPFYSEADVSDRRGGLSVESMVSGGFRVVDGGVTRMLSGTRDWGSDIATIKSGCGSGAQVLVSAAGDGEQDALVAYEIDQGRAVAASAPLGLDGRVIAMWAAAARTDGSAMVITEQAEPRRYEVYRVAGTCGS